MSHIGCSSHVKYQDANCFSFSQATLWPSPRSWLVPIQNSQVGGTVIPAIFYSSICFIFCSWLFPSLLVSLMIASFLLFFSFVHVCVPYTPLYSIISAFFPSFLFFFPVHYDFFFHVSFPILHFCLKFWCVIPSILPSVVNQAKPKHTKYITLSYIVNMCTIHTSPG